MSTCPPIARDRLTGLADISKNAIQCMEDDKNPCIPPRLKELKLTIELRKIINIIDQMLDPDIFVWLNDKVIEEDDLNRATTIIADRLCGAISDPIIRNAQEKRQLFGIFE